MSKYSQYIKRAKELGAKDAKIIAADTVVTAEWVRIKCQYGCSGYGRRLICPPKSPTPEQTKKMLNEFKHAILIHTDEKKLINKMIHILEKEIFFDGYHKAFAMGSGPCNLCGKCEEFCANPHEARPAMEACGIDVFSTVRKNGFPIETLSDKSEMGNYYGLVLIE